MKRSKLIAAVSALLLAAPLAAQQIVGQQRVTLAANFDLDGAAASVTAIHSADQIVDSTAYTIDAQPDTPRPLTATLTDADSSITDCTLTVVGALANGTAATSTATLTGGSGAKALSPAYNFATVTSSTTGVCTGEAAGDLVSLGTTSTIPAVYLTTYGASKLTTQSVRLRDPFVWTRISQKVKTVGSTTALTSNTASSSALTFVDIGDLLLFTIGGENFERVVTEKTDADNVTLGEAIDLTAGYVYSYRKLYRGDAAEDAWFGVQGYTAGTFIFNIAQMSGTGGINTKVECEVVGAQSDPVVIFTDNVTVAGQKVYAVDFRLAGYERCRAGLSWGTNDDAVDTTTAQEKIGIYFVGTK